MAVSLSSPSLPVTRRRFLKATLCGAAGLALYAGEAERHFIQLSRRDVHLPGLSAAFDGLRLAQLSDIHLDEFTEPFFLRHAVELINRQNPDIVLLTGDFVSSGWASRKFALGAAWQCANILTGLNCLARYAVLGNHDVLVDAKTVAAALTANRIAVLDNDCLPIERSGSRFWLAGLNDPVEGHPRPDLAIPPAIRNIRDEPVVLMCHAPDYADKLLDHPAGQAVALMLSGHTHGGQVRLPFVRPMGLPPMGRKYIEGWFRLGSLELHVNRGLGTVGVPFRFDCPPEISLITLRADKPAA
jgi:predicted MPP superfamily phosphohydrolase